MISAESFYFSEAGGLCQGDILLTIVARITGNASHSPPAQWEPFDTQDVHMDGATPDGSPTRFIANSCLAIVRSHDCQLEKEWNRRQSELIAQGRTDDEAATEVAGEPTLERTLVASPLVDPNDIPVDRGNLLAEHVVEYVPIPASPDGLVPECVVDLSCRCTLDRFDVVRVDVDNGPRTRSTPVLPGMSRHSPHSKPGLLGRRRLRSFDPTCQRPQEEHAHDASRPRRRLCDRTVATAWGTPGTLGPCVSEELKRCPN